VVTELWISQGWCGKPLHQVRSVMLSEEPEVVERFRAEKFEPQGYTPTTQSDPNSIARRPW